MRTQKRCVRELCGYDAVLLVILGKVRLEGHLELFPIIHNTHSLELRLLS